MVKLRLKRKGGAGNIQQDWELREDDLRAVRRELNAEEEWKTEGNVLFIGEAEIVCPTKRLASLLALLRNGFVKLLNDNTKLRHKLMEARETVKTIIRSGDKNDS